MTVTCLIRRLISSHIRQTTRKFHASSNICDGAYEGDGKTTLTILNKDFTYGLMIDSYSEVGFRLNNGIMVVGPLAIFPRTVLSWKISGMEEINEETLSLFSMLEPKLDVLIIGIGNGQRTSGFNRTIASYTKRHKVNIEVVPTNQACAIFNFLNAEGRFVGAGIIPLKNVSVSEFEMVDNSQNLKVIDSPTGL